MPPSLPQKKKKKSSIQNVKRIVIIIKFEQAKAKRDWYMYSFQSHAGLLYIFIFMIVLYYIYSLNYMQGSVDADQSLYPLLSHKFNKYIYVKH